MTHDPKPGAPVRLTDEQLDELGLHISHPRGSRVDRLYVEARRAREAETRYIEALKGVSDSPAAGRDGPLLAICTARYALGLKDLITDELTKLTFGLKDRAEAAETERDAAVKRAEEAEFSARSEAHDYNNLYESWCRSLKARVEADDLRRERDTLKAQLDAALARPSSYSSGYDDGFKRSEQRAERDADRLHIKEMENRALCMMAERDALRSRLEEMTASRDAMAQQAGDWQLFANEQCNEVTALRSQLEEARAEIPKAFDPGGTGLVLSLETALQAARDRIGQLEGALLDYCRHGEYCTLSQAIPAEDEGKHHCTCGLSAALAPAPAAVPTREVLTPEQAEEMRKEGAALSEEIKRRTAPMKRWPFEPRVDTSDMPGKGDGG